MPYFYDEDPEEEYEDDFDELEYYDPDDPIYDDVDFQDAYADRDAGFARVANMLGNVYDDDQASPFDVFQEDRPDITFDRDLQGETEDESRRALAQISALQDMGMLPELSVDPSRDDRVVQGVIGPESPFERILQRSDAKQLDQSSAVLDDLVGRPDPNPQPTDIVMDHMNLIQYPDGSTGNSAVQRDGQVVDVKHPEGSGEMVPLSTIEQSVVDQADAVVPAAETEAASNDPWAALKKMWRPGVLVANAKKDSYTTDQGTHAGGPASDIFADEGSPIFAPVGGYSKPNLYPKGGYATIFVGDDGKTYYMAHGAEPFKAGRVEAGEIFGAVGSTGTGPGGKTAKGGTAPHLHVGVATDGNIDRGVNGGSGNVWLKPDESWIVSGQPVPASLGVNNPARNPKPSAQSVIPIDRSSQDAYRATLMANAIPIAEKYDLPAEIIAAIPIQEGGWSGSQLQRDADNLFSIKGEGPAGSQSYSKVWEVINGQNVLVPATFRKYNSAQESFEDFAKLITQDPNYANAVKTWRETRDPAAFIKAVHAGGPKGKYATDPTWSDKVIGISRSMPSWDDVNARFGRPQSTLVAGAFEDEHQHGPVSPPGIPARDTYSVEAATARAQQGTGQAVNNVRSGERNTRPITPPGTTPRTTPGVSPANASSKDVLSAAQKSGIPSWSKDGAPMLELIPGNNDSFKWVSQYLQWKKGKAPEPKKPVYQDRFNDVLNNNDSLAQLKNRGMVREDASGIPGFTSTPAAALERAEYTGRPNYEPPPMGGVVKPYAGETTRLISERDPDRKIDAVVLDRLSLDDAQSQNAWQRAEAKMKNESSSYNYVIAPDGQVTRLVPENLVTRNAGMAANRNALSVSLLTDKKLGEGYTKRQLNSLNWLLDQTDKAYGTKSVLTVPEAVAAYGPEGRTRLSKDERKKRAQEIGFDYEWIRDFLNTGWSHSIDDDDEA